MSAWIAWIVGGGVVTMTLFLGRIVDHVSSLNDRAGAVLETIGRIEDRLDSMSYRLEEIEGVALSHRRGRDSWISTAGDEPGAR